MFTRILISPGMQSIIGFLMILLGEQIKIPFYIVPFTLQTLSVYFIALVFSRNAALTSVMSYIIFKSFSLTVFPFFSFGPTYGYLIGFIACTFVVTAFRDRISPIKACLLGSVALFVCGVSWLAMFVGLKQALYAGYLPFIITDYAKIFVISSCVTMFKK